jgi:hypothetical protein
MDSYSSDNEIPIVLVTELVEKQKFKQVSEKTTVKRGKNKYILKHTKQYYAHRASNRDSIRKCRFEKKNVVPKLEVDLQKISEMNEELARKNKEQIEYLEKNYDLVKIKQNHPKIAQLFEELNQLEQSISNKK